MSGCDPSRIRLWWPTRRHLGGICLGEPRGQILARGDFVEEVRLSSDPPDFEVDLRRLTHPEISVVIADGIAVSIGAYDECFLDDVNLIGLPLDSVAWRVGGIAKQTVEGVSQYETGSNVELLIDVDGLVSQVHISDWSMIPD